MTHVFEVEEATQLGINAAIVLDQIRRWIAYNKANGKNEHEGRTWTFNSVKSWAKLVPYLTDKQVRKAIDDLVNVGAIIKGNFNSNPNDRTLWYSLGDSLCPGGQIPATPFALEGKGSALEGKCVDQRETNQVTIPSEVSELKAEAERFVDWFVMLLSTTGAPTPRLTPSIRSGWADAYEKLRRIDGKEKAEIAKVCEWARNDGFWRDNFFSPVKLRDRKDGISRYDQFLTRITSNGHARNQRPNPRDCESTRQAVDAYREYDQRMASGQV